MSRVALSHSRRLSTPFAMGLRRLRSAKIRTTALAPLGERVASVASRVRGSSQLFSKQQAPEPRRALAGGFVTPSEPFRKSKRQSRQVVFFAALFATVLCPLRVEAHLNSTGLGPVYDGLAHFLLSPEDLVPVLALALFAGLRGAAYGRRALFVLPGAWLLGGFVGMAATTSRGSALTAISFLLLGGFWRRMPGSHCALPQYWLRWSAFFTAT